MAETPNYEIPLPTPGASAGVWGSILNEALSALDEELERVEEDLNDTADVADGALQREGGTLSGPAYYDTIELGTESGAVALDLDAGNVFRVTLDGATTFSFTNAPPSGVTTFVTLEIERSGTPSVTWPSGIVWDEDEEPELGSLDVVAFMIRGTLVRGVHAVRG